MKIQQPRWAWGGESHKELKFLLHSIPRQELEIKALGESGENELVQQEKVMAKRGELLEVYL
jgi:hypothetical protein